MADYSRKKISELESSLQGKKIEVVGKIVKQPTLTSYQFYAQLRDAPGNMAQLQGRRALFWKNEFERILEKAFATNTSIIVRGNYQCYGWSSDLIHCITLEEMKIVDYLRIIK